MEKKNMRLVIYGNNGQILREIEGCQYSLQLEMLNTSNIPGATSWELKKSAPKKIEVNQQEIDQVFHSYKWRG